MKLNMYKRKMVNALLASACLGMSMVWAEPAPVIPQMTDDQATQKLMMAYRREFVFLDFSNG